MHDPAGRLLGSYADIDLDDAGQLPKQVNHGRVEIVNPGLGSGGVLDDRLGRFLLLLGNLHFQPRDAILNRDWRLFWFPTAPVVEGEVDGDGDYANKNNKRNDSTTHFAIRCATQ